MYELITDKTFDLKKTNEYKLSIQVSLGGFSFSIIQPEENRLLALKNSPLKISNERFIARRVSEWIESEEILQQKFSEVRVIVSTGKFSLVPENFYLAEKNKKITGLFFDSDNNTKIVENRIDPFNLHLLFTLPDQLENALKGSFNNCSFLHPVKLMIEQLPEIKSENGLILLFEATSFFIILFDKNQLLMVNSFKITHANDILYYVLTSMKQMKIVAGKTQLFIVGQVIQKEETESRLKDYFKSVELLNPNSSLNFDPELFKYPLYPFITLLS